MEKEFYTVAKAIKHDILRRRIINYYRDLAEIVPSVESPEEKYNRAIKNITLENLEKLVQNAWLDEIEECEKRCLQNL